MYDEKAEVKEMEAARKNMLQRLEQLRQRGVELYLAKAVRENSPYMADYVLDAQGAIEQVRFDKVTRR